MKTKCWKCKGPITGPWRTVFAYSDKRKWYRRARVVCVRCYECFDSAGNEVPELVLLSEMKERVPVLGVDILPSGGTDDK